MRNTPENSEKPIYVQRVNLVIDHVVAHLDRRVSLEEAAEIAGFSSFHFHRIFRAVAGETLNDFGKRLRLEKALDLLAKHGPASLTEIALRCGFQSSSDFSRSFKSRFGVPPSVFDLDRFREQRRLEMVNATFGEENAHRVPHLPRGENPDGFRVELIELPARRVAYLRVLDPYRAGVVVEAAERFVAWAEDRNLAQGTWLGYMWDNPEIVAHCDCRYDVGLEVSSGFRAEGEIGVIDFPPMTLATIPVVGGIELEMRALDWIFETWLPSSAYAPTDLPSFEAWHGRPFAHGIEHFALDVQLPVQRMS
ncbi:MAG: AraC family transcriptional regulator [Planctomycetota bacterium]